MKKLKGFTLLELIIVMAIFSIIMYSAVQLLDPVSKFFVRSSNFENTTACTDNMRRCIEGNLKYADRVRVYSKFNPYASPSTPDVPSEDLKDKVRDFYSQFFEGRKFIDTSGIINVLVFDNSPQMDDLTGMDQISDYTKNQYNRGKIVQYRFEFDNYGRILDNGSVATPDDVTTIANNLVSSTVWCVNQKLYGNFDYTFTLNDPRIINDSVIASNVTTAATVAGATTTSIATSYVGTDTNGSDVFVPVVPAIFNPRDFNIGIAVQEIKRIKLPGGGTGLTRSTPTTSIVASFSMKNVLNASDGYKSAALDYVPTLASGDESGAHSYYINPKRNEGQPIPRYTGINENTGTDQFEGFYFIFTLPEEMHDVADRPDYNEAYLNSQVPLTSVTP